MQRKNKILSIFLSFFIMSNATAMQSLDSNKFQFDLKQYSYGTETVNKSFVLGENKEESFATNKEINTKKYPQRKNSVEGYSVIREGNDYFLTLIQTKTRELQINNEFVLKIPELSKVNKVVSVTDIKDCIVGQLNLIEEVQEKDAPALEYKICKVD